MIAVVIMAFYSTSSADSSIITLSIDTSIAITFITKNNMHDVVRHDIIVSNLTISTLTLIPWKTNEYALSAMLKNAAYPLKNIGPTPPGISLRSWGDKRTNMGSIVIFFNPTIFFR